MTLPSGRKTATAAFPSPTQKDDISSRLSRSSHDVRAASASQLDIINNNRSSFSLNTRMDVPSGFLPPSFKDCILSNVLRSGKRCMDLLKEVRESLSNLVAEDEELSKGIRKENPSPEIQQLSLVAEALCVLTREGFVPMHRLNQAAVGLYVAEDFLRNPAADISTFDILKSGKIKVPDASFNAETVNKLREIVDKTAMYYNKFNLKRGKGAEMQDIMLTFMRSFQDMYTLSLGCLEVFKVLLYTTSRERINMQEFLISLSSMERSDMLTEVQDLRRLVDEIVIFLEKLSWGCFVVYRLSRGKESAKRKHDTATVPNSSGEEIKNSTGDPEPELEKGKEEEVITMPDEQTLQNRLNAGIGLARILGSKKKKRKAALKDVPDDIATDPPKLTSMKKKLTLKQSSETNQTADALVKNADSPKKKETKKKETLDATKRVPLTVGAEIV